MKNLKCIIGATLLTPIIMGGVVGILYGTVFLFTQLSDKIQKFILFGLPIVLILFLAVIVWTAFYDHCVERKKRNG